MIAPKVATRIDQMLKPVTPVPPKSPTTNQLMMPTCSQYLLSQGSSACLGRPVRKRRPGLLSSALFVHEGCLQRLTSALPRLGDGAYLPHHAQGVVVGPALRDPAVGDAVYGDARDRHLVTGGSYPHELTLVRATAGPARDHPVTLG